MIFQNGGKNKMAWYDNIYKIAIEKTDLGEDFPKSQRYEFRIITYDQNGNSDKISGHFTALNGNRGVNLRVKEITDLVKSNTSHTCNIEKSITEIKQDNVLPTESYSMSQAGFERARSLQELRSSNRYPGGNRDHSER